MSKLNEFLNTGSPQPEPEDFTGMEWHASVSCQFCMERVSTQTLYPDKCLLVWTCSEGHRSKIENYTAF